MYALRHLLSSINREPGEGALFKAVTSGAAGVALFATRFSLGDSIPALVTPLGIDSRLTLLGAGIGLLALGFNKIQIGPSDGTRTERALDSPQS